MFRTCTRIATAVLFLLAGACSVPPGEAPAQAVDAADLILTNGNVCTMEDAAPKAQAVAVKGDRIVCVGDAAGAAKYEGAKTEVIDLGGKAVLPGFVSAHDNPAWQLRMEDKIGSLEVGKLANVVILDRNILELDAPEDLLTTRVLGTIMDGRFRYGDGL